MSRPNRPARPGIVPICLLALTLAACATTAPPPPGDDPVGPTGDVAETTSAGTSRLAPGKSAQEVRGLMAGAMRRPGYVYHRRAERRQEADIYSNSGQVDHWLAADAGQAREAMRLVLDRQQPSPPAQVAAPGAAAEATPGSNQPGPPMPGATLSPGPELLRGDKIVSGGRLYDLSPEGEIDSEEAAPTCPGLNAAVSMVLSCRSDSEPVWTLEDGRYRGQDAIILVATYALPDSQTLLQVDSLYLNPVDFLPWGLVQQSQIRYGIAVDSRVRADYVHAFIPAAELSPGVFDPQAPVEPTPRVR